MSFSDHGKVVRLLPLQAVGTGASASVADIDCRGYDWMYIVFDITVNSTSTGNSTLTLTAAPAAGGAYAAITDDSANMVAGGSNVSAVFTQAPGFTGTQYGEIDLRHHDNVITATFQNGTGGSAQLTAWAVLSGARYGTTNDDELVFQITSKAKSAYA